MSERGVADHRAREDRISFLPDHLLCKILSDLPTNMAVRTSVLSKRWKSLWLSVPLLDLHIYQFPDEDSFVSFVHGFLHVSKESCLLKLKLAFNSDDDGHMNQWIDYAVLHKVQHLDLECRRFGFSLPEPIMPLSFYTCETLLHLKLDSVMLSGFEHASLPRLKILHLIDNIYTNDAFLEKLISSCPLLEDLTVVDNGSEDVDYVVKVLRVRSQSLKTLVISLSADKYWDSEDDDPDPQVVIDAPGLNFLSLKDDEQLRSFVINNLSSSAKVDIDVNFGLPDSKTSVVRKFFTMLSSVRDMTIRGTTMKCLQIRCLCLKYEPLPQFPYMIRFHGVFCNSDLKELPNFLDICPNLESLVLELEEFKKNELLVFSSSSVPECLRTSLEYVEMKTPISGARAEMKLIKYFLENSAVLKKFKLCLGCRRMNQESIIFMELLRLKRCSASCEVVVELEEASSISQKFL